MKIGLGIGAGVAEDGNLGQMLAAFERAEGAGFDGAWMPNIFAFDAVMMLALAGRVTSRLELGTFVVPTYPRHPVALAQQALTASAATNGRFTLGIGLSHKVVIENMLGLDYSKPVRHMREYLSVLTPLLSGEQVMHRGEEYRVMARVTVPDAPKPPVIVAALGPQMLRLAGKMADGTATWMGGPRYLRETAIPTIRAAAAEAGRPAPRIVSGFPIAVTSRVDDAKEAAAKVFANYGALPSYRAVLDVEGAPGPADVAIIGSETEVEAQLRQLSADGVTDFNASIFPVAGDAAASERTYELLSGMAKAGV
ncbi:MAG: TIGR03564 family F420-dependent LLM class oxidoreductase [Dehalococcoidia bacterium]|nr:TIGR03564 family F420-dependent LLM class oxidoreductase [Dehalococcoidia bacterium]